MKRQEEILKELTIKEKIALCTGKDFWHTKALAKYGIPAIKMSDGPHGLRCQGKHVDIFGINESEPATCFPTAVTAGATWNRSLYEAEGAAIGREAAEAGVSVLLGPGCNIKRNPLGGRNFEYLSEDPYLSGHMAAAFVRGVQTTGVSACLKHFAVNNQENKRNNGDSILDERTLREIYLTPFEIAVKEGHSKAVMCSYNKINGTHASDNKKLLRDILRDEWGFDGVVMTDWGALNDRIEAFRAGCDLNMPGGSHYMHRAAKKAVRSGYLKEACVDASAERVLCLMERGWHVKREKTDADAHHALALKIAEQGAVLLKNENRILPLDEKDIVLIGPMVQRLRYQGTGSSHINPKRVVELTDALPDACAVPVGDTLGGVSEEEIAAAENAARSRAIAVVAVGLPESYESEGFDRAHMGLPEGYNELVTRVSDANENTVVVLFGGGVMELPWAERVRAILYMGLPGEAGGTAVANLLTGKTVPSGKLTESWPLSYRDAISSATFGKKQVEYREGIYVGYRYYQKAEIPVRYPFGYGLSYTQFTYDDLRVNGQRVSCRITNTGEWHGAEVVQLYIGAPTSCIFRPKRELRGFERVELSPGETKSVEFSLDDRSFAVWSDGFRVPRGSYTVEIGASSDDIRLSTSIEVAGEDILTPAELAGTFYDTAKGKPTREAWETLVGRCVPIFEEARKGSFTMDHTFLEMREESRFMRFLCFMTDTVIAWRLGVKRGCDDPTYRMMLSGAVDGPLRLIVINSGGALKESVAHVLLRIANGRSNGRRSKKMKH